MLGVADDQQRFEPAQRAVLPPVLGQLDRGAREILELGELAFELLEQRDAVGRRAGEAGQDLAAGDLAHLARAVLDDRLVERHLTVAGNRELAVAPHGQNRRRANSHASVITPTAASEGFSGQAVDRERARARPCDARALPLVATLAHVGGNRPR